MSARRVEDAASRTGGRSGLGVEAGEFAVAPRGCALHLCREIRRHKHAGRLWRRARNHADFGAPAELTCRRLHITTPCLSVLGVRRTNNLDAHEVPHGLMVRVFVCASLFKKARHEHAKTRRGLCVLERLFFQHTEGLVVAGAARHAQCDAHLSGQMCVLGRLQMQSPQRDQTKPWFCDERMLCIARSDLAAASLASRSRELGWFKAAAALGGNAKSICMMLS